MSEKKQKMLITGSTGLIGSYFCRLKALKEYEIYTVAHSDSTTVGTSINIDLSGSMDLFRRAIDNVRPDIIVHLAAMTDVEQCEIHRDIANAVNHLSVKTVVDYLDKHKNNNNNNKKKECFVLFVSTDYVFNGGKGNYSEEDATDPINWYGMTKRLAEQELLKFGFENWCIARTSTPFGVHNKKLSFPLFVVENLSQNREIKVLTDQITSPTYALNLTEMLFEIIEKRLRGIIHVSGSSQLSRFDQALLIASMRHLDKKLIHPTTIKEMSWKARRPKNSSLDSRKAYNNLVKKPMAFEESLLELSTEMQQ